MLSGDSALSSDGRFADEAGAAGTIAFLTIGGAGDGAGAGAGAVTSGIGTGAGATAGPVKWTEGGIDGAGGVIDVVGTDGVTDGAGVAEVEGIAGVVKVEGIAGVVEGIAGVVEVEVEGSREGGGAGTAFRFPLLFFVTGLHSG